MPFAINEATRFISPTKTPEYLAAGKPVVSTPVTDVVRHYGDVEGVSVAGDAASVRQRLRAGAGIVVRPGGLASSGRRASCAHVLGPDLPPHVLARG